MSEDQGELVDRLGRALLEMVSEVSVAIRDLYTGEGETMVIDRLQGAVRKAREALQ